MNGEHLYWLTLSYGFLGSLIFTFLSKGSFLVLLTYIPLASILIIDVILPSKSYYKWRGIRWTQSEETK